MSSFIIETALDSSSPHEIHFIGPANGEVKQQVTGKVNLVVFKPVQLKQLSVAFLGEVTVDYPTLVVVARSDPVPISKVDFNAIDTPTQYKPGTYSYPFTLSLPSDLPTTESAKLKDGSICWKYEIQTCAVPTGLFLRRKMIREEVTLRRFHVAPSDSANMKCTGKRKDLFECSLDGPKFITIQDHRVRVNAFLHPYSSQYKVKDLEASITQTETVRFASKEAESSLRNIRNLAPSQTDELLRQQKDASPLLVNTNVAKPISNVVKVLHPDQEEFSTAWGREHPVEFDLELLQSELQPSEDIGWLQIKHGIRITVNFVDPAVKSFSVVAPLQIGRPLSQELWAFQAPPSNDSRPPGYGVDDDQSILLDANTSRVMRNQLHYEAYPEREPVVPDMMDSLPPMYEHEGDQPEPYSEEK
ncbi:hypothetical protein EMPS_03170 [Entomortierella parvispora]|uniref:Arrestin-like N-terminal domain-containing protein n=1 Tax=Entomortierella parvispora TaxID=205924 RepID=A0A9P3H6A9_9FUNG|nr:hypothetical protein EMPS_03170 [Entomortierella parvispora]